CWLEPAGLPVWASIGVRRHCPAARFLNRTDVVGTHAPTTSCICYLGLRLAQCTNAGKVLPSSVGSGFSVRDTPGPKASGIVRAKPADTYFAGGLLRSKLIVTLVGVDTIDEITPVACSALTNEVLLPAAPD